MLPSGLFPVVSAVDQNATRVPSAFTLGSLLIPMVDVVSWTPDTGGEAFARAGICGRADCSGAMAWRTLHPPCQGSSSQRSEEHTSELQSLTKILCRLLLAKTS